MLSGSEARSKFLRLHAHELTTKCCWRAEQHNRSFAGVQFAINPRVGFHSIYRRDEKAVHSAREQASKANLFAVDHVVIVRQQNVVAEVMSALLNGIDDSGEDWICAGGNHESKQFGRARA